MEPLGFPDIIDQEFHESEDEEDEDEFPDEIGQAEQDECDEDEEDEQDDDGIDDQDEEENENEIANENENESEEEEEQKRYLSTYTSYLEMKKRQNEQFKYSKQNRSQIINGLFQQLSSASTEESTSSKLLYDQKDSLYDFSQRIQKIKVEQENLEKQKTLLKQRIQENRKEQNGNNLEQEDYDSLNYNSSNGLEDFESIKYSTFNYLLPQLEVEDEIDELIDEKLLSNSRKYMRNRRKRREPQAVTKVQQLSPQDSENQLNIESKLDEALSFDLKDKLAFYKKIKQHIIRLSMNKNINCPNMSKYRQLMCQILYDQVENEQNIRKRNIPYVIGYIFNNQTKLDVKLLNKLIDEKEFRLLKVKSIKQDFTNSTHRSSSNIVNSKFKPFYSQIKINWLTQQKNLLSNESNQTNISSLHTQILKQLYEQRDKLAPYEHCTQFRELLSDILLAKAYLYFNHTSTATLVAPFLLQSEISLNFIVKCLIKPNKHEALFSPAAKIIKSLSEDHKSLLI